MDSPTHSMSQRILYFELAALILAFVGRGLCLDSVGPTLLDLLETVNGDIDQSSYIFISQSLGVLIGSLISPKFFGNGNDEMLLAGACLLQAVATSFVAIFGLLPIMCTAFCFQGLAIGVVGIGVCSVSLKIGGKTNGPSYLQAVYLGVSIGAIAGPIMVQPFLSHQVPTENKRETEIFNFNSTSGIVQSNVYINPKFSSGSNVKWFYVTAGLILLLPAICFLLIFISQKRSRVPESLGEDSKVILTASVRNQSEKHTMKSGISLLLIFVFSTLYYGMQDTFANLLTVFSVTSKLRMSKMMGNYMSSMFWGTMAIGRLLGIAVARRTSPEIMIIVDLIGSLIASGLLILLVETSQSVLWILAGILGLSWASLNGSVVAWSAIYIKPDKHNLMVIFFGRCTGLMSLPPLVAVMFDISPMVLMYALGIVSSCIAILFCFLHVINIYPVVDKGTPCNEDTTKLLQTVEHDINDNYQTFKNRSQDPVISRSCD
ncbi:unnamed protein product [Owenia fusiformis]|uniref:Uncharacterized protein n=1 Tax=Owenia fusiformis TaxID=6347 RepID=A0A8J1UD49_OWEFU|nr:unnamed protein product [Owenia fusiformis]